MNKLMLILSMLLMAPCIVQASAVLPPTVVTVDPDILTPDNTNWTGTKYAGIPAKYSGLTVGSNINYLDSVVIHHGTITVKLPGQATHQVQQGARVSIILKGNGAVSYKAIRDAFLVWNKLVTANTDPVAVFEDSGIKINTKNYQDTAWNQYTVKCPPCKSYPEWTATITASMTLSDFETQFVPAFNAWNSQYSYLGAPSQNDISGNGMSGKILVYKRN